MADTYILYSPDVEMVGDDEDRLTAEILEIMASTNRRAFERHRHAVRDAHAKSHGFLKAELIVPELQQHLRQGLFARPGTYPVVIRLSSAPGDIHSDTIPAPRGMAIKVLGVEGERLLPGDTGRNQDFLLVNIPVLSFGTIGKYRQLIGLLEKNAQNPAFLQRAMAGVARGVEAAVEAVGVEPGATLRGLARDNDHLLMKPACSSLIASETWRSSPPSTSRRTSLTLVSSCCPKYSWVICSKALSMTICRSARDWPS